MNDSEDEATGSKPFLTTIKTTLLRPLHPFLSLPARRAYLRTLLLLLASLALAATATVAYTAFYHAYIPARGLERAVHLQFAAPGLLHRHPYGVARLPRGALATQQRYDVKALLCMPRSPANLAAGNFMLELELRGAGAGAGTGAEAGAYAGVGAGAGADAGLELERQRDRDRELGPVLARSRRPAILTYRSAVVEMAHRVARLPWYVVGWRQEEETVEVGLMEGVEFQKGWRNVPASLRLEVASASVLQVYGVKVVFTAKFAGLRYIMYNHRILSFAFFTTIFWSVEMTFLLLTWAFFAFIFSSSSTAPERTRPKREPEDSPHTFKTEPDSDGATLEFLSDTSRTFPTFSRQPPLRYSAPRVKEEEGEPSRGLEDIPLRTPGDADDEDEDADFVLDDAAGMGVVPSDSGLGTSLQSSVEKRGAAVRRRSGRPGRGDGGGG